MKQQNPQDLIQKIRKNYTESPPTDLDALKALDRKVTKPVATFAWVFGIASALVMGSGMSLMMTNLSSILSLGDPMVPGLILGLLGLVGICVNYPLYAKALSRRRKKFAPQIIALSDQLSNP